MLYRFAWTLCRTILLFLRGMEVHGLENIPASGGLVVASNHKSYWDPIIVGCAFPKKRHIFFMAKAELFKIPVLGAIIHRLGAFPVKRDGADRSAIRIAINHLVSGEVVGIFPEGTRNKSEGTLDPHLGAAMLASKAFVPVMPVAVIGSRGLWGKVKVMIGEPMFFESYPSENKSPKHNREQLLEISRRIMERIMILMQSDT